MSTVAAVPVLAALSGLACLSAARRRRVRVRLGLAAPRPGRRWLDPATEGPPGAALVAAGAAGLAALVATAGPAISLVLAMLAGGAALGLRRRRRAEWRLLRRRQLTSALDRLGTALRAGSSLPVALAEAAAGVPPPLGPELATLAHEAEGGRSLVDVLDGWTCEYDDAGTRLAASAMVLATAVGAAPARAIDGVATTLRERIDLADERRALAAQTRLSAFVLSVAPLGFGLMLGVADGPAGRFLLGTPAGGACLLAGITLDLAGAWWMARLTRGHDA